MKILSLIPTYSRRTILVAVVVAFTVSTNVSISKSSGNVGDYRRTPPPLDPPRDPGPIPTVGGGTVTVEPGPTIIVTRRGVVEAAAAAADTSASRRKSTSLPGFTPTPSTSVPPTVTVAGSSVMGATPVLTRVWPVVVQPRRLSRRAIQALFRPLVGVR